MKTIVAVSTAPMTSAIGIVRISGDRAFEITEKVFSKPLSNVDGYRVVYGKIYDGKKILDTVLATVFRSPNSYTGEDTVEISCHGSPYILNAVFEGYMAENLLHYLSNEGIDVSTGSAWSSKHGSHVFKALGLEKYQKNALRFSFSQFTTEEEINKTADTLKDALGKIIKKS